MLLTALLLCASQIAAAEPLPDPTRPAIDLNSSGTGSAADVVPDEDVSHGLQSIIISPQYRAAIINGETVNLGGKSGDSRLVEVQGEQCGAAECARTARAGIVPQSEHQEERNGAARECRARESIQSRRVCRSKM